MKVLMLGWEFPPFITGGLGTACYGLTRALDARGTSITFVLPRVVQDATPTHVDLLGIEPDPGNLRPAPGGQAAPAIPPASESSTAVEVPDQAPDTPTRSVSPQDHFSLQAFQHTDFIDIHGGIIHTYQRDAHEGPVGQPSARRSDSRIGPAHTGVSPAAASSPPPISEAATPPTTSTAAKAPAGPSPGEYTGDLMTLVRRYADACLQAVRGRDFDLIHAHDWMTYPAGLTIARVSGRPLVVHVHSTEFDRAGEDVDARIFDIERRGMHGALRVIAVSQLTKNIIVSRYGVPEERVEVVYNGVEVDPRRLSVTGIAREDKIVLYFGRITYQKGPEYFIRAAKRVLEHMENVKFVVAGSGDLARHMMEMASELGIGHRVIFTGFLRGDAIRKVFEMADLYVMPSVSEPFGIAPLEAMSHNVPVLISKSSGVSEVLHHALKVDFWDVDEMANKIMAVLRHPPLGQTLREHGSIEVRQLTWEGAAVKCEQVYQAALAEMVAG